MKKIISFAIIFSIIFTNLSFFNFKITKADTPLFSYENSFIVTAYYSPLPNQNYYFKGSYEADIKLNGKGIKGASGKEVFPGMFAAPKNYDFGTKIYLEGVGIGEVADRGGAIVSAEGEDTRGYKYDRIDIWMGYGEEGLARALNWGKKTLKGYIIADSETTTNVNLNNFPAPISILKEFEINKNIDNKVYTYGEEKINKIKKSIENKVNSHIENIGNPKIGDVGENVRLLQKTLKIMGYLKIKDNAVFGIKTKNSLIKYQIDKGIILGFDDEGAGYFGPKTRKVLKNDLITIIEKKVLEEKKLLSYKK